jgi:hypothetical protein
MSRAPVRVLKDSEKLALLKGFLMGLSAKETGTDLGTYLGRVMEQVFPEDFTDDSSTQETS